MLRSLRVQRLWYVLFVLLLSALPSFSRAQEKTPSGFVYPVKSSWSHGCGAWLGRDSAHGGCYFDGSYHIGEDMITAEGSNVFAISRGTVRKIWTTNANDDYFIGPGNSVIFIEHKLRDGTSFLAEYMHVRPMVSEGDTVTKGQVIAKVGPWYNVAHCHFGIHPSTTVPTTRWGIMPNSAWPDTNGFVDPVDWINNRIPDDAVSMPDAHWTHGVIADRWYRSDEHLDYAIGSGGDSNWDAKEWIDGNNTATYNKIGSGYIALSYGGRGWHEYEATCTNSVGSAYTGRWKGGWDPDPPSVQQTGGPAAGKWSNQKTVQWTCSDALAQIRGFRWHFNGDSYNALNRANSGSADFAEGKTTLWVQAEDNAFTGTGEEGNKTDTNLGEFWIDTVNPSAPTVSFNPPSPGRGVVTVTSAATDGGSGVDRIELWVNGQKMDSKAGGTVSFTWDANAAPDKNTIRLVAFDLAGNSAATDSGYDIDRSVPVASLALTPSAPNGWGKWYKSVPMGTLTSSAPSGVASLNYQIGEGAWIKYTAPFTIPGSGTVTVRYYAVSNAGVTGPTAETTIKIDATAPPTPSLQDEGAKTSSLTTFWMSILNPDPESGIGKIEYKVGDASLENRYRDTTPIFTSSPFLLADGLWVPQGASVVIKARVFNGAGVASAWVTTDGIVADLSLVPFAVLSALNPVAAFAYELPDMIHWMTLGEPILGESTDGSHYSLTSGFWSSVLTTRVVGKVQLQDFAGDITKVPLTFEFRAPGGNDAVATVTVSPDSTGAIAIDLPLTGTYDVYVKASHWLRAKRLTFALSDGDLGTLSLINGDINGDNQITATDQALLSSAFRSTPGSQNWNPNADLNGDNQVTSTDQAILSKNFRKVGS